MSASSPRFGFKAAVAGLARKLDTRTLPGEAPDNAPAPGLRDTLGTFVSFLYAYVQTR